jgi:hypothetical protein
MEWKNIQAWTKLVICSKIEISDKLWITTMTTDDDNGRQHLPFLREGTQRFLKWTIERDLKI